jgi:hypothetical protein
VSYLANPQHYVRAQKASCRGPQFLHLLQLAPFSPEWGVTWWVSRCGLQIAARNVSHGASSVIYGIPNIMPLVCFGCRLDFSLKSAQLDTGCPAQSKPHARTLNRPVSFTAHTQEEHRCAIGLHAAQSNLQRYEEKGFLLFRATWASTRVLSTHVGDGSAECAPRELVLRSIINSPLRSFCC